MVESVHPHEVVIRLRERPDHHVLLDVREPEEREIACIHPSLHIPLAEVPRRLVEIPRDKTVVVYCHHGSRSAMVAGFLESMGFSRVANLEGGIDRWSRKVDPTIPRYG